MKSLVIFVFYYYYSFDRYLAQTDYCIERRRHFGTILAVGITFMFMFHVLVNIGMTAGIMPPVTGVPLPFMSYGVSSLTTNILLMTGRCGTSICGVNSCNFRGR